ncbi:MAG: cyclase family protein [Kiritimatiellaeota bacterium]|nr:cyclase family protein [Kiritimatiellota bacterium]
MYPGTEAPKLHVAYTHEEFGFMETLINMFSHTGTHVDAPAHLFSGGLTLDKYPIGHFVGKARVVDCRNFNEGGFMPAEVLEEPGNPENEAEFVLFRTGHDRFWGSPDYFKNFPVMPREVAEWVNRRKFKGIGVDAPSFDPVTAEGLEEASEELHNHRAILETGNTLLYENLRGLDGIGAGLFTFCALPLNIANADGAPVRVIAMI